MVLDSEFAVRLFYRVFISPTIHIQNLIIVAFLRHTPTPPLCYSAVSVSSVSSAVSSDISSALLGPCETTTCEARRTRVCNM